MTAEPLRCHLCQGGCFIPTRRHPGYDPTLWLWRQQPAHIPCPACGGEGFTVDHIQKERRAARTEVPAARRPMQHDPGD